MISTFNLSYLLLLFLLLDRLFGIEMGLFCEQVVQLFSRILGPIGWTCLFSQPHKILYRKLFLQDPFFSRGSREWLVMETNLKHYIHLKVKFFL